MGTKANPGKFDCYEDALPDEPMFVLLARDPDFYALVDEWSKRRTLAVMCGDRPQSDMAMVRAAARFIAANPGPRFSVGDLVTPVKDSPMLGAGDPHIVIATRGADYDFTTFEDVSDSRYGMRLDIRVLSIHESLLRAHWVESAYFAPWPLDKG